MKLSDRIETIAIFRALQLGDLLCSVPAFRTLRHAFPHAHITLIGLPWARTFAQRFKYYFNDAINSPGFPGLPEQPSDPPATLRFIRRMQRHNFDLVLQMHGNGTIVNPLITLWAAKQYAGFYRPDNYLPNPETFMPYPEHINPEILRHLQLLEFLGIPPQGTHLEFPLSETDHRDFTRLRFPFPPRRYVILHPGARADNRQWGAANFARLGDLVHAYGFDTVITGVESEQVIATEVIRCMKHKPLDLTGRTSLGALGVLVQNARLVIANDTGISHIADALHTPSVIISLSHDPERWTPLDRHRHIFIKCRDRECFVEAHAGVDRLLATKPPP